MVKSACLCQSIIIMNKSANPDGRLATGDYASMNKAFLNMIRNEDEAMPAELIVDEEKKNKIYSFYGISNEQEEGFQTLRIHH